MAGYILLDLEITDPEGFQGYLKLTGPTVKHYGGKVLVGGAVPENLEGDWHPRLFSIGEFESVEQALRWYNSEEYAPAKALRFKVAKNKGIVVQGLEPRKKGTKASLDCSLDLRGEWKGTAKGTIPFPS